MEGSRNAYVVDDDPGVRNSLCLILEAAAIHAVGFASAEDFLAAHQDRLEGCLVLDLRLNGMSGLELLQHLRGREIHAPVIMITGHGDVPVAVRSMKLGAVDFLEKPIDPRILVQRVAGALEQHERRRAREDVAAEARGRFTAVSAREMEVLQLLAEGKSSKQIAGVLQIAFRTVENHRAHMLIKTRAENIADLIRLAALAGLVR